MKYKIGDKFWCVRKEFNRLRGHVNKIKMVDADGVEWFRYDKDVVDYDLSVVDVVGTFQAVIEGENIWNEEEYCDRYCVSGGPGMSHDEVWEEELDGYLVCGAYVTYWATKEDAEKYIKEERERDN